MEVLSEEPARFLYSENNLKISLNVSGKKDETAYVRKWEFFISYKVAELGVNQYSFL